MLSSLKPKTLVIRESKIVHKSSILHQMARFVKWRKRWRKHNDGLSNHSPKWWAEFFIHEFRQAFSKSVLRSWGELVGLIKFAFTAIKLQEMRESYRSANS